MTENLKTGTTTVGIKYKDGVILATDRRATAGNLIVDKKAKKLHILNPNIAVTIAGNVSDAQLFIKYIKAEVALKEIRTERNITIKEAANMLGSILYSGIRQPSMMPSVTHFLLGGKDGDGQHLYDIFPDGSITEIDKYVSSGSGSVFAYGVLESAYKKDLTESEATKLVIKCVNAALQRDSASGNGIDIAKVTTKGAEYLKGEELVYKLSE